MKTKQNHEVTEEMLTQAGLHQELVDVEIHSTLTKHLTKDSVICTDCRGTGVVVEQNVFGIGGVDTGIMFPFKNESYGYCKSCYNGVRKVCVHCNALLKKGHRTCNCDAGKIQEIEDYEKTRVTVWDEARKLSLGEVLDNYEMVYVEQHQMYLNTSDLEYWLEENKKADQDTLVCRYEDLRIYVTSEESIQLNANGIVDSALDDLHEDADVGQTALAELQTMLDAWCEQHGKDTTTYVLNENIGVILP